MAHIVRRTSDNIVWAFPTAVAATAYRAAQDTPTDFTVIDTGRVDLPTYFVNGVYIWNGTAFAERATLTQTQQAQAAARAQLDRIEVFQQALRDGWMDFPERDRTPANDTLIYAKWGSRAVFLSDDLTFAQKIGWAQQSAKGPTDLNSGDDPLTVDQIRKFFSLIHLWSDTQRTERIPTQRILFASPIGTYTRWTMLNANANSKAAGTRALLFADPATQDDLDKTRNGLWIDDISI